MKAIFGAGPGFTVADGTRVMPLVQGGDGVSVALGEIAPRSVSRIHVHPVVTQITLVLAGRLTVTMKDAAATTPYILEVHAGGAVLTEPGTFLSLANGGEAPARVAYIVTPAWVSEGDYDDAVVLEEGWEDLARAGWRLPALADPATARARRAAALTRRR